MEKFEDASIFILLHQVAHISRYRAMKGMEALGVKPNQAGILFVLYCEGKMSQRQLAEKIGITPPSMTVALRKLEDQGLILKKPDAKDQRVIQIQLSDRGRECIEELKHVLTGMEDIVYHGISPEERMLLRRLLMEMSQNLLDSREFKGMDIKTVMEKTRPPMPHDCRLE